MTRLWVCLAKKDVRDAMRRAVCQYAPDANVLFVDSAAELRSWARDAAPGAHVAIGPLGEGFSALNVAAAVVRDGRASEVVLVCSCPDEEFGRKANLLGADAVIELNLDGQEPADNMDEPIFLSDEIPTLVMDVATPQRLRSIPVIPRPEETERQPHNATNRTVVGHAMPVQSETPASEPVTEVMLPSVPAPQFVPTPANGKAPSPEASIRGNDEHAKSNVPRMQRLNHGEPQNHAPIIVLVSGRGGVGKTSVLAAMASAAASWNMNVAACDLDLTCGNLYSCFGAAGAADLGRLAHAETIDEDMLMSCGNAVSERVTLWGSCDRPEMADAVYPHTERLLDVLARRHDLVLVDTPATFTDAVAQAAQQCDRLVLVVDGRPGSSVAQARLGGLAVRLGVARTRIARLANRCGRRAEPTINRGEVGLETARPLRVFDGGAEVSDCLAEGRVRDLFDLGSRFAESSAESLAKMLGELGCLPDVPEAKRLCERRTQRSRWTFGRMREAV